MRIWSLHPKHLDIKGLVALWRETLLAKHVLEGKTKGYKNHPQLIRFKKTPDPVNAIHAYLSVVHEEATLRGYNFDKSKFNPHHIPASMPVTSGQVNYEVEHLLHKLKIRDPDLYLELSSKKRFPIHPIFKRKKGDVEDWEVITST
jgi:hypothetical protein